MAAENKDKITVPVSQGTQDIKWLRKYLTIATIILFVVFLFWKAHQPAKKAGAGMRSGPTQDSSPSALKKDIFGRIIEGRFELGLGTSWSQDIMTLVSASSSFSLDSGNHAVTYRVFTDSITSYETTIDQTMGERLVLENRPVRLLCKAVYPTDLSRRLGPWLTVTVYPPEPAR